MKEIYDYLKKCGTYYLATMDGDQPRVRPFGTVDLFDGQLTIQTGRVKDVARQMFENPRVELCACDGETWLRVEAVVEEMKSIEAQAHMLDAYPSLRSMYAPGDGNTCIFALKSGKAVFSSFAEPAKIVEF